MFKECYDFVKFFVCYKKTQVSTNLAAIRKLKKNLMKKYRALLGQKYKNNNITYKRYLKHLHNLFI